MDAVNGRRIRVASAVESGSNLLLLLRLNQAESGIESCHRRWVGGGGGASARASPPRQPPPAREAAAGGGCLPAASRSLGSRGPRASRRWRKRRIPWPTSSSYTSSTRQRRASCTPSGLPSTTHGPSSTRPPAALSAAAPLPPPCRLRVAAVRPFSPSSPSASAPADCPPVRRPRAPVRRPVRRPGPPRLLSVAPPSSRRATASPRPICLGRPGCAGPPPTTCAPPRPTPGRRWAQQNASLRERAPPPARAPKATAKGRGGRRESESAPAGCAQREGQGWASLGSIPPIESRTGLRRSPQRGPDPPSRSPVGVRGLPALPRAHGGPAPAVLGEQLVVPW